MRSEVVLPAPFPPRKPNTATGIDREAEVVDGKGPIEALGDPVECQHCHAFTPASLT